MQTAFLISKKISAILAVCSMSLAVQAQVIDPLNGTSSVGYTTTLLNDGSHGGGLGISFTQSGSGLQASYVGTGTSPEQSIYLSAASAFGTAFTVGTMLTVKTSMAGTGPVEDFGLAIASTATPSAGAASTWDSRASFDWASISLRPSQNSIRVNTSISGALNTSGGVVGLGTGGTANVSELFIAWMSADVFAVGYVLNGVQTIDETITFAPGSNIGDAIGFYGDLRATGTSLGTFSNLEIAPVPEPSTLALGGLGFAGLFLALRQKKSAA